MATETVPAAESLPEPPTFQDLNTPLGRVYDTVALLSLLAELFESLTGDGGSDDRHYATARVIGSAVTTLTAAADAIFDVASQLEAAGRAA